MGRSLALFLLGAALSSAYPVPPEVLQAIHAPLEYEAAAISPDGKWLGCVQRDNDAAVVRVFELDAVRATAGVRLSLGAKAGSVFDRVFWVSPTRLVAQIGRNEVVAVDADGRNARRLVDWEEPYWYEARPAQPAPGVPRIVRVVAWSADAPDFVYIEAGWLRNFAVVRVHHRTGKAEIAWEGTGVSPVAYDRRGLLRVRQSDADSDESYEVRMTDEKAARWTSLDRALGLEGRPQFAVTAANFHGPRSVPLGMGSEAQVLYFATNVGRDTMGIYAVDLRTRRRTEFVLEHPQHDLVSPVPFLSSETTLVRERTSGEVVGARFVGQPGGTVWVDTELRAVQERIEKAMPDHRVRIENWDDTRERFLVLLSHRADPGGFAVFSRSDGMLRRVLDRARKLGASPTPHSTVWAMKRPDGTLLTGNLTLPARVRSAPTPVIVILRPIMWNWVPAEYSGEIRELAEMGYAVLEVAHRGTLGRGMSHWEAGRQQLDQVVAEDVFAAVDRIGPAAGLDCGKVAVVGARFGALLALKMAHLAPARIACVVAEGRIPDFFESTRESAVTYPSLMRGQEVRRRYFGRKDEELKSWSPRLFAPQITRPMMIVAIEENRSVAVEDPTIDVIHRLQKAKKALHVIQESPDKGGAEMRARIGAAMEKFLGEHLPTTGR